MYLSTCHFVPRLVPPLHCKPQPCGHFAAAVVIREARPESLKSLKALETVPPPQ
jgi:hypothetical protein